MPQQTDQPLLLFVINPISGGKNKVEWESAIRNFFADKPYRTEFFVLSGNNDGESVQHYIRELRPDKVVAVGGDGTVKMLAEQLSKLDITMGILPAGSANGMARELGIPTDIMAALNVLLTGREKRIDAIEVNKHICIHLSDIGLNAQLVKYFESHPRRGMVSYGRFILKVLWFKKRLKVLIDSDNEDRHREAYMVVVANARMYGTGAAINPHGDVSDGMFEIVILRQLSVIELLKMLLKVKSFNVYKTEIIRATRVKLRSHIPAYFQVDGEYIGKTKEVYARILPGYLRVILPAP